ncbi:uncharacterized protein PAC_06213 [Phialocephala subalpina]|uniref:2EXR domain-containing protein n=1 Tax=Phialocephala subalpina TaxID=576137 RepID=A0A1L7WU59_9HELO|nr:uncharacterized protein PAC_06213 [Phialocephala subalpina]
MSTNAQDDVKAMESPDTAIAENLSSTSDTPINALNDAVQGLQLGAASPSALVNDANDVNDADDIIEANDGPTFRLFSKLVPELRLKIWEAARPVARIVRITKRKQPGLPVVYSPAKVPALLHACSESRQVALRWYELAFQTRQDLSSIIYLDHSCDVPYFSCETCNGDLCSGSERSRRQCGLMFMASPTDRLLKTIIFEYNMPGGTHHVSHLCVRLGRQVYAWQEPDENVMNAYIRFTDMTRYFGASHPSGKVFKNVLAIELGDTAEAGDATQRPSEE